MRRTETHWNCEEAIALLTQSETLHLASNRDDGKPVLRALHAVVVDEMLAFHGAKAGERRLCLGMPTVVTAERILANVPSYWVDPERACPATTYFESAQVQGPLVEITDMEQKARVIAALMHKYQPEGGHVAVQASHPLYEKALRGLFVFGVRLTEVTGKIQYGQRRKPNEMAAIYEGLWERGESRDILAIARLASLRGDDVYRPKLKLGSRRLRCDLRVERDEKAVVELLEGSYWNAGASAKEIASAHRNSSAWVGCSDEQGKLIASARAVSDGARFGWVLDMIVAPHHRGSGVGKALMALLLDHPRLRSCRSIGLGTRDAIGFYEQFGFRATGAKTPGGHTQMVRPRDS